MNEDTNAVEVDSRSPGSRIAATLGYDAYADLLASTISTLDTPATVGIFAGWGCGKSALMQKIKENLDKRSARYPITRGVGSMCFWMLIRLLFFTPPESIPASEEVRFICVYFNALEYAGSDHLWAGLVTRLVNSVEFGIGMLPSAIFRANVPGKAAFARNGKTKLSNDAKKNSFKMANGALVPPSDYSGFHKRALLGANITLKISGNDITSSKDEVEGYDPTPKMVCGKIPLYAIALVGILLCLLCSIALLVYTFVKRDRMTAEYADQNNGTIPADTIADAEVRRNVSVGAIFLSVPVVVVCRNAIPIILKLVHTHASQIKKIFSKPDFSRELGVMAKIKHEIKHLSLLVRFMELFEQRRIVVVIFIDDLDKLPPQSVAPLLQTIKIILSDPNRRFVSVIAMDPSSVSNAIEMGIQSQFPAMNISGHKFLKQLIQVPFTIPYMSNEEKRKLLSILRRSNKVSESEDSGDKLTHVEGDVVDHNAKSTPKKTKQRKGQPLLGSFNQNHADVRMDILTAVTSVLNVGLPVIPAVIVGFPDMHLVRVGKYGVILQYIARVKATIDPLYELRSVNAACDFVLLKLLDEKIFPYVNNNYQEIQRLVGTANVTTRMMFHSLHKLGKPQRRAAVRGITAYRISAWMVLINQWPYRLTWMIQDIEDKVDSGKPYDNSLPLLDVYSNAEECLILVTGWKKLIQLDCDPDTLVKFLKVHSSWLTVTFLRDVLPYTPSLDRSLKTIVMWTSVEMNLKSYRTHTTKPLLHMDVEDVVLMLKSCCKNSRNLETYRQTCYDHNINGVVLLDGEIQNLKECLNMTLGDWTMFHNLLIKLRNAHKFKYS